MHFEDSLEFELLGHCLFDLWLSHLLLLHTFKIQNVMGVSNSKELMVHGKREDNSIS